jgi:hypothetical protein
MEQGTDDGGVPDGEGGRGAPDGEGAWATHRTERAHRPGMHVGRGTGGGWRRTGVGHWRAGGEVGVFPTGAGGESVDEI